MNTNIYHDNITAKTQVTTNTITLIYLGLYGSVAKRVSDMALNIPYLS